MSGENREKKPKKTIFSTLEDSRRLLLGLPAGDPNTGTKGSATLLLIVLIIVGWILYVTFT